MLMNNDLLRYRLFLEPYGTFDVTGRMWQMIQVFMVDLPFQLLTIIVSGISFFLDLIDFTDSFAAMRLSFFNQSRTIFLGFIGGSNGRIAMGTIGFAFFSIALIYLIWHFFFGRENFSKKLIHVLIVIFLAFAYFGSFNEGGRSVQGGIWLIDTVDNVATELRGSMITTFTFDDSTGSPTGENASLSRYFESHVVRNTWRFLHSGSFQGEYAPGQFLDESRLIPDANLSGSELDRFESARDSYLRDLSRNNPYVRNSSEHLMEKMFMVTLAYANLLVLGIPIVFVNLTISAFQLVLLILLLFFPFALILSFIPFMRNAAFRVLKMIMGILILPVLLSFLLGVIFYLNQVIDGFILARAGTLLGIGVVTMSGLPAGNALLILFFVMVAVKGFFLRLLWKNKGKMLQLLSDGKLDDQMMNQPKQVIDNAKEKVKEKTREVGEKAMGVGKIALGVSIGHPGLMADGIVQTTSAPRHSRHSMKNILDEHFIGDNNKLDIKGGLSSLKERASGTNKNALYSSKEFEAYSQADNSGIQEVKVMNPDELKEDEKKQEERKQEEPQQGESNQEQYSKDNIVIENPEIEVKQEQNNESKEQEKANKESTRIVEETIAKEDTVTSKKEAVTTREETIIPKEEFISQDIPQVHQGQQRQSLNLNLNQENFTPINEQLRNQGPPQKDMETFLQELRVERDRA